jgi:hypothetical protein
VIVWTVAGELTERTSVIPAIFQCDQAVRVESQSKYSYLLPCLLLRPGTTGTPGTSAGRIVRVHSHDYFLIILAWLREANRKQQDRQRPSPRLGTHRRQRPIPDGMQLLHRCDNRRCTSRHHLTLGTHDDNMQDMVAKGTLADVQPTCERNYNAWLTAIQMRAIRDRWFASGKQRGLQTLLARELASVWRRSA